MLAKFVIMNFNGKTFVKNRELEARDKNEVLDKFGRAKNVLALQVYYEQSGNDETELENIEYEIPLSRSQ